MENHWTEIRVKMVISDIVNILKKYLNQARNVEVGLFILALEDSGTASRGT